VIEIGVFLGALLRSKDATWKELAVFSVLLGTLAFVLTVILATLGLSTLLGIGTITITTSFIAGLGLFTATIISTLFGGLVWDVAEWLMKQIK